MLLDYRFGTQQVRKVLDQLSNLFFGMLELSYWSITSLSKNKLILDKKHLGLCLSGKLWQEKVHRAMHCLFWLELI